MSLKKVATKVTMMQIPEDALLHGVVKQLDGREAFNDADADLNEKIYHGDIFEAIASEWAEMEGSVLCPDKKTLMQLDELAELVDTDYVQIVKR